MKKLLTILIIITTINSFSQVIAPNFGETDIYGNNYNLYEQLDSGKAVILDFFGTTWPSCINSAPYLDSLWQVRGFNGDSLWIWGFAVPHGDSTEIEAFKDSTGVTFPCFERNDGDSVKELYNISYTPKYFAVCPDHSMKGFDYGDEDMIMTFIDNCSPSNISRIKDKIFTTYFYKKLFIISNKENDVNVSIINILGQEIKKNTYHLNIGTNIYNLNLEKGIYIVKIYSKKYNYINSLKIIVE